MTLMEFLGKTMAITAIYWQPNERLLTVRTAEGANTQIGGRLSDEDLEQVLGPELTAKICEGSRLDPSLSDLAVHALRGDHHALGYLRTDYKTGQVRVVPAVSVPGGIAPAADTGMDPEYDSRPRFGR